MSKRPSLLSNQDDLFGLEALLAPIPAPSIGFVYRDGLVSPEEEHDLVECSGVPPFKPFE